MDGRPLDIPWPSSGYNPLFLTCDRQCFPGHAARRRLTSTVLEAGNCSVRPERPQPHYPPKEPIESPQLTFQQRFRK